MAARPVRRTTLSVEALEDRLVLSSTALLPLAAPQIQHEYTARHARVHHGHQSNQHHQHLVHGSSPQAANSPTASFFDVFVNLDMSGGSSTASSQADQDRHNAELDRKDAAGWRESAGGESDPTRKQEKLNAAGDADQAAADWEKAADARDKGDGAKADKLEQAAKLREDAAREWGANGDSAAAQKAENAAKTLEDQAK